MIGRLYGFAIGGSAKTAAVTLMEIAAPADAVTTLERAYMSQSSFDTSENLAAKVEDVGTTGTGSTAVIPRPLQEGDALYGGVLEYDQTIEPTYSGNVFIEQGFNVLSGWLWTPANDDEVIVLSPSQLVGIMIDVAPSGSMDFHYGCTIREIGG